MTKLYFGWGLALVATLALLGGALVYPDSCAPVADDAAAALVGGDGGCDCYSRWNCAAYPWCTSAIWLTLTACGQPCDQPNTYGYNSQLCGSGPCSSSHCATGYGAVGPCITKCPPGP
jgi:hypothetical protein